MNFGRSTTISDECAWFQTFNLGHTGQRLLAAVAAMLCVGLLAFSLTLFPDSRGYGTHQQIGIAPCLSPVVTGYPCPTCGMTTAFAHTVRGQWIRAFNAQPAGLLLALLTGAIAMVSTHGALTGRLCRPNPRIFALPRVAFIGVALWLSGWGYKVALGLFNGTLPLW